MCACWHLLWLLLYEEASEEEINSITKGGNLAKVSSIDVSPDRSVVIQLAVLLVFSEYSRYIGLNKINFSGKLLFGTRVHKKNKNLQLQYYSRWNLTCLLLVHIESSMNGLSVRKVGAD